MDTQNIPENDQEKEQLDNQNTGSSGSAPAGNSPQGAPYGQNSPYGQGNSPYGQSSPYGQNNYPYGSGYGPYGQGGNPYGQNNYPYGQSGNPYGQNNYPYGQSSPYGQNNYPYGQGNPYGQSNSPYGQGNPYGQSNYPYGQNNYPYGQSSSPYGQNNYPYGSGYGPYGQNGVYYTPSYRPPEPKRPFAIAAMILGICSLVTACTVFLPIPLGALGAIFFILSGKKGKKPDSTAIAGLATSIAGIALGVIIWVFAFISAFNMFKPENRDLLNERFEEMYGMDLEEYFREIYGD